MTRAREADPAKTADPAGLPGDAALGADELSFEAALERLEQVVSHLEGGELELEAALAAFEDGVALSRRCAEQLKQAERRIQVLTRESGEWTVEDFEEPEESDD
ncbi:MAG: exodeoxyribonuclease VII small subunit [Deltaproteobacteria bacterium]|nr:exodeoxyribonuclease VII small subunit [Deltaproteobacteria bacterium]